MKLSSFLERIKQMVRVFIRSTGPVELWDWHRICILADAGISFYSVSDGINLADEASRLPADIFAAISTHYIRNLRREVLKGFYGRLKQGYLPLPCPIGYVDKGGGKKKQIDSVMGPLVAKAFELYNSSRYGTRELSKKMYVLGLRNKKGKPITKTGIQYMLKNKFYIGIIQVRKRSEEFQGNHQPLISNATFRLTQKAPSEIEGRKISGPKHDFMFRRLLKCKKCHYSMSGEI